MKLLSIIVGLFIIFCIVDLPLADAIPLGTVKHDRSLAAQICEEQCLAFAGETGHTYFESKNKTCRCSDEFGYGFGFIVVTRD